MLDWSAVKCLERSDEAIQAATGGPWIASTCLAMTIVGALAIRVNMSCAGPSGFRVRRACAKPADQRVRADRDHEHDDQQGVHARHIERAVAVDHEEADTAVRQFGFGEQGADDGAAEPEPDAVDDR